VIVLDHISIQQGKFALTNVSLTVPTGAYAVLMGRTGSGKTTILEAIIGFRRPASGRVVLDNVDVTRWNPAVRGVGYVPQDGALFSRMSVRDIWRSRCASVAPHERTSSGASPSSPACSGSRICWTGGRDASAAANDSASHSAGRFRSNRGSCASTSR
jgi:ABC-type branched-subunit amino acid transport system ATPase component